MSSEVLPVFGLSNAAELPMDDQGNLLCQDCGGRKWRRVASRRGTQDGTQGIYLRWKCKRCRTPFWCFYPDGIVEIGQ